MLRPATPLSLLLFAAFCLLLLSVLSTPIIQAVPLGSFKGVTYGVFGFCTQEPPTCSGIEVGYNAAAPFVDDPESFDLPSAARNTLSSILIVHPVAALLTLVMFILAVVSHLHSPSHSARYLLFVFIFSFIDFLICLMAFLIDVLLFVPHMAWGSYIVLAATILVACSGLVSCAMRRTLVTRKARKKRIAENAEMSGENYYNREAQAKTAATTTASMQPTVPTVSGALGSGVGTNPDSLPTYASFESQKKDDQVSDERIPLTSRTPSDRSPNNLPSDIATSDTLLNGPARAGSAPPGQRDQYGNPIDAYGVRRGPSFERMNSRGRTNTPPGGYRGRGGAGYGPPGRNGSYNGYGPPPNGRGGYGGPGRGGYGPPGGRGGYGPPPRGGYGASAMMRGGRPPPGYQNASGPYDRRPSPANAYDAYGADSGSSTYGAGTYQAYDPERGSLPRAESPPPLPGETSGPVGQAVEMDAQTGSPRHPPSGFGSFRESDSDIAGMVGLQQGRGPAGNDQRHDTYMSEDSKYSTEEQYVPPRQGWAKPGTSSPRVPSPLNIPSRAAELPAQSTPPLGGIPEQTQKSTYYEDVDPRFAASTPRTAQPPIASSSQQALAPYDDLHDAGARSPGAESDKSNFTSISQRGVNPRWNPNAPPQPPLPAGYGQSRRAPPPQRQDMLLNANPDFQLQGSRTASPANRGGGGGMVPGSSYPGI